MPYFEVKDFKGGITDFEVGADTDKYQRADNLVIQKEGMVGRLVTRPGSEVFSLGQTGFSVDQIPAGSQRIGALFFSDSLTANNAINDKQLIFFSGNTTYYQDIIAGTHGHWETLTGVASVAPFFGSTTSSVLSLARFGREHLFATSDNYFPKPVKLLLPPTSWVTVGLPDLGVDPVPTGGTPGTTFSYIYRFIYSYTYTTAGGTTYTVKSPSREVVATNNAAINAGAGNTISWATIHALTNGAGENYDLANVVKEIYRTTNGGSNFFLVASITNVTTTYADTMPDATLLNQEPMYTEGGAPEFGEIPHCKLMHCVNNTMYYANIYESGASTRFYQSIVGTPEYVPATFFGDLAQDISGISSVKTKPIMLCKQGDVYRIDGVLDEFGRGDFAPTSISAVAGCLSSSSIVQALEGIFWAGIRGFYYSDGYSVLCVSLNLVDTYKRFTSTFTRNKRICGKFHPTENRIYWTIQLEDGATDCDTILSMDLNYGISDSMPFTTWSGGINFAPTCLEIIDYEYVRGANGATDIAASALRLVRGDTRGYAFTHKNTLFVDPIVDTTVGAGNAYANWNNATVIHDFISASTDFGTSGVRKLVSEISVVTENDTNLSLQIRSINDKGRKTADLAPIRYRGNVTWGDPDLYWGDATMFWNYAGLIDDSRMFPAKSLRCEHKQVQFTNAKVAIVSSDLIGTAVVDGTLFTATLTNASTADWPLISVGYYLAFANDGYVTEYHITARTSDTLTFSSPGPMPPTGTYAWVLRGYPQGEVLNLVSYSMLYQPFSTSQRPFMTRDSAEPGTST